MADESLAGLSINEFLSRLASASPTPGGGSAAALSGALATALGQMVAALTLGRPKFAAVEAQVRAVSERLSRAGALLRGLIDEDAAAYEVLSQMFKLHKADPQRGLRVAAAAGLAARVPLETAAVCATVLADLEALRRIGNPQLRSDAEAAVHLARAAFRVAAANVRANLPFMSTQEAGIIEGQLAALQVEPTAPAD